MRVTVSNGADIVLSPIVKSGLVQSTGLLLVHLLLWKHANQIWQAILTSRLQTGQVLFDDELVTTWI